MTDLKDFPCPKCERTSIKDHCSHTQSVDCNWLKCTNRACQAVLDRRRRKGFRPVGSGSFEHFTFGQLGGAAATP